MARGHGDGEPHYRPCVSAMPANLFSALGDPTRLDIFETLARQGSGTATALAGDLRISRQAVAKHLSILQDAGLAIAQRVGRETRFEPQPEALHEVADWVSSVEHAWDARLAALAKSLEG